MVRPLGVYHRPVVSLSAQPPSRGKTSCTSPFPKLVAPTITARSWSWSAPATISDADALSRSVSTTSGAAASSGSSSATYFSAGALRYSMRRMGVPGARKRSEMRIAWSRLPPVFPRRSRTNEVAPCPRSAAMAAATSPAALSLNPSSGR
jgi:hypothetical protein